MTQFSVRPVGYTGTVEEILWTPGSGNNVPVTAYLWGGGGGGGGNDAQYSGGSGSGGGFSSVNLVINEGDQIQIAVGGNGTGGVSNARGGPGGSAGGSYTFEPIFNIRTATPISYTDPFGNFYPAVPTFPRFSGAWGSFLNTYGVWIDPWSAYQFANWYQITVPVTGTYTITQSSDAYSSLYSPTFLPNGFFWQSATSTGQIDVTLTAGTHYMYVTGVGLGTGGIAVTIGGGASYSGGRGGYSGYSGSSGAGGGGGGATVLLLNNSVVGVAGGGGGGGGAGYRGAANGQSAPGARGQAAYPIINGQNGIDQAGDGGGAGGGGGGYGGGNGGLTPGGDQGAYSGGYGGSYSGSGGPVGNPTGQDPAGAGQPYYSADRGRGGNRGGGAGTTGSAVLVFNIGGLYVYTSGQFQRVAPYAKFNNAWQPVQGTFIKQDGIWQPIVGVFAPTFNYYSNLFGVSSRPA